MSFEDLIDRKYQILGETADSEKKLRDAQAGLVQSQTATNPAEAAAREAAGYGSAAQGQGLGGYYSALGASQSSLAASEVQLRGAQTGQAQQETSASRSLDQTAPSSILNQRLQNSGLNSFSKGTDKVPGKAPKTGNTDTTPAMLTPGEAVLNVGAAEHLGRDTIDVLNAIGNIKMMSNSAGVSQPAGPATKADVHGAGGIPGYATGTSGIDPMPGQDGTWGPSGDAQPAPGSNAGIRGSVGLPGVPRPAPKPGYFAEGTSDVGGHNDVINRARSPFSMEDFQSAIGDQQSRNEYDDKSQNKSQGPTPLNQSNMNFAKKNGEKTLWNGPEGDRKTQAYAKGTSKVPGKGAEKGPAKGASKITPEMLQAIMHLGKGGGGLIPPGQGSPMPGSMPMPQVAPGQGMR